MNIRYSKINRNIILPILGSLICLTHMSFGQSEAEQVKDQIRQVRKALQAGDYQPGLRLAQKTFWQSKNLIDRHLPLHIDLLSVTAEMHYRNGNFQKADSLAALGLEQVNQLSHDQQRRKAYFFKQRGAALTQLDRFPAALSCFEKSLEIAQEYIPNTLPFIPQLLNRYGQLLVLTESFDRARSMLGEALRITRAQKESPPVDQLEILLTLAELELRQDHFEQARNYLENGQRLRKNRLQDEHPVTARLLGKLGKLSYYRGETVFAKLYYQKADSIFQKHHLNRHPVYAEVLENLGILYSTVLGDKVKAEELFLKALEINRSINPTGFRAANNYGNLAQIYLALGNFPRSFREARRSIRYLEDKKLIRPYTTALNNLASIYFPFESKDSLAKAEALLDRALDLYQTKYSKKTLRYATFLANRGALSGIKGQYEQEETAYREALGIIKELMGTNNRYYSTILNNLAIYYDYAGELERAEATYLQVAKIEKETFGKLHPNYTRTLYNIAGFYDYQEYLGNYPSGKALDYYRRANARQIELIRKYYAAFEEQTRLRYLERAQQQFARFFSYGVAQSDVKPVVKEVQKIVFNIKGLALDYSLATRLEDISSIDPQTRDLYRQWQRARIRYADTYLMSVPEKQRLDDSPRELREYMQRLSSQLARRLQIAHPDRMTGMLDNNTWAQRLPANHAAVDFFVYQYFDGIGFTEDYYYCALVIRPEWKAPRLIELDSDSSITQSLSISTPDAPAYIAYSDQGYRLYQKIWAPIDSLLDGVQEIHLSPDGLLQQVVFTALPTDSLGQERLLDRYRFHRYSQMRNFRNQRSPNASLPKKITLFGGARYDLDSARLGQAVQRIRADQDSLIGKSRNLTSARKKNISQSENAAERAPGRFNYLPGTEREVLQIDSVVRSADWQSRLFLREDALEESLQLLSGKDQPGILHLATHGFFFEAIENTQLDSTSRLWERIYTAQDPLFRSGLVFSGCNIAWQGRRTPTTTEDQILTAFEVANLELDHIRLAILSACDTGRGDIQNAEGVFGLQRAFRAAGVNQLLLSMWRVSDQSAARLMQRFYQNLTMGAAPARALRQAKIDMRSADYPAGQWGGFVLIE